MGMKAKPNFDIRAAKQIPEELRDLSQWVCWKSVPRTDTSAKPMKVPINPKTGEAASPSDSSTWGSFAEAADWYLAHTHELTGVGFVFAQDDDFVGIDLDDVRATDGSVKIAWAKHWIRRFNTYTEEIGRAH